MKVSLLSSLSKECGTVYLFSVVNNGETRFEYVVKHPTRGMLALIGVESRMKASKFLVGKNVDQTLDQVQGLPPLASELAYESIPHKMMERMVLRAYKTNHVRIA
jgi:hypothetical protein